MLLLLLLMYLCGGGVEVEGASLFYNGFVRSFTPVTVELGPNQYLRGSVLPHDGVPINTFTGVRFAEPPTGSRRFQPPVEANAWTGVTDALQTSKVCMQVLLECTTANACSHTAQLDDSNQSEDCLFLNVFSPDVNASLPVIVWIHGGYYRIGDMNYEDMSGLAAHDVVVVAINYRLGPFGFLSTGDDVMPGNYGMLDQVMALKWVQKNIHAFGGDPGRVTIQGQSAGASSVSLHMLSPLSAGLFHGAIMQSGAASAIWAVERPETRFQLGDFTRDVAKEINCSSTSASNDVLSCLQQASAKDVLEGSNALRVKRQIEVVETPRVETTFGFLPDYPEHLFTSGKFNKVPTLGGYNTGEWSFAIEDPDNNGVTQFEFIAYAYGITRYYAVNRAPELSNMAVAEYKPAIHTPYVLRKNLVDLLTDISFSLPMYLEMDAVVNQTDPSIRNYAYQFDYRSAEVLSPAWMGVVHSEEKPLVFGTATTTPADREATHAMQVMWTNFAKSGNPTMSDVIVGGSKVTWDPYTRYNKQMLSIEQNSWSMKDFSRRDKMPMMAKMLRMIRKE